MDKRRFNKGTRGNKGGRRSRAEELRAAELGTDAIIAEYGSLEKYWRFIAGESKTSLPHLKLIHEYIYGKPKEKIDVTTDNEKINAIFPIDLLK